MTTDALALIALLCPIVYLLAALYTQFVSGNEPVKKMAMVATTINLLPAAGVALLVYQYGTLQTATIGTAGMGLSLRLDPLSALMIVMIALLGFIVIRFSINYLDGDARQKTFLGRLSATIAAVQLLVLAGNLGLLLAAWVAMSIGLNKLLTYYHSRPGAIIASRKKLAASRVGDIALAGAVFLLYQQFGTGDLGTIFQQMKGMEAMGLYHANIESAAVLIVIAALLKSAQFPTHGWLLEVMEAPTPVSALLHAGLLNAGPFLVVRMAFVMNGATIAPVLLIVMGGLTALFASVAFLTQPAVKTALGYSSVAHMGFMLLVCGLGVYPAVMLHLVAHSFYKAHAFLSSGSVIDVVRAAKVALPQRLGSPIRILASIAIALGVYLALALLLGISPLEELPLVATGAIIVMGLAQIIAPTLDSSGGLAAILRASLMAAAVATAFFVLEGATHHLLDSQLPLLAKPAPHMIGLIVAVLSVYTIVVALQMAAPAYQATPFWRNLATHFRNGWYANAVFDRLVGGLYVKAPNAGVPGMHKPALANRPPVHQRRKYAKTGLSKNKTGQGPKA